MSQDPKATYFDAGGIETIDIIRAKLTHEQFTGWLLGNVIKYAARANWKHEDPRRDVEKIALYAAVLQRHLEQEDDA